MPVTPRDREVKVETYKYITPRPPAGLDHIFTCCLYTESQVSRYARRSVLALASHRGHRSPPPPLRLRLSIILLGVSRAGQERPIRCRNCQHFYLEPQNHDLCCAYHTGEYKRACPRSCPGLTQKCMSHRYAMHYHDTRRRWHCPLCFPRTIYRAQKSNIPYARIGGWPLFCSYDSPSHRVHREFDAYRSQRYTALPWFLDPVVPPDPRYNYHISLLRPRRLSPQFSLHFHSR